MKKYLFILCCAVLFFSCNGITGYKSPHEKRNLTVINTTGRNIDIIVKARYNSVEYFNGTLNAGQSTPLNNVPLCMLIPKQGYDWRVEKTDDHSDNPVWRIRSVTDDEKLKVPVYNTNLDGTIILKYKVKAPGTVFETSAYIDKGKARLIKLYDTDYEFFLENAERYWKKKDNGDYDKTATYWAIKHNSVDNPPEWSADPKNPADKDKVPAFFTINYDKAAQKITITQVPTE